MQGFVETKWCNWVPSVDIEELQRERYGTTILESLSEAEQARALGHVNS